MKKFYLLAAFSACFAVAGAQTPDFTSDITLDSKFAANYDGNVTITNCTVTIGFEEGNTTALPFYSGETITLSEGGKVKFYDSPDSYYPVPADGDWTDFRDASGNNITEIPFNWIIDGDDNEIYLDSYCAFGGTISGSGSVTIYTTSRVLFDVILGYAANDACPGFNGTIYLKALDGYSCDTIVMGANFKAGYAEGVYSTSLTNSNNATYASTTSILDVNGLNNPVIDFATKSVGIIPQVCGPCEIILPSSYQVFSTPDQSAGYDAVFTGGNSGRYSTIYGGPVIFNENSRFNASLSTIYQRRAMPVVINSTEPSFSNIGDLNTRAAGSTFCGNGWLDATMTGQGRAWYYTAGDTTVGSVGTLTVKNFTNQTGPVYQIDFDNAGNADKLVVTDTYTFNSGRNDYALRLPSDFFVNPQVKNYKVIDAATYDASMQYYVDTIGFYFLDGTTYMMISPTTGDTTTYSVLSGLKAKYPEANRTMVNNREIDTLRVWSAGSFTNGEDPETYINTVSADLYVPNHPWALGGALDYIVNDPDDWFYEMKDSLEKVTVVPGCGDSVLYNGHSLGAVVNGGFGSFDESGSSYIGAITYKYYYWSANTIKLAGFTSGSYSAPDGSTFNIEYGGTTNDSTNTIGMSKYEFPISRQEIDKIEGEDTTYVTVKDWTTKASSIPVKQANGDTIYYWFNFQNLMTNGTIGLCAQVHHADGTVGEEQIPTNDDSSDIKTMLKENHAVLARTIMTLDGRKVKEYQPGINIVKTEYTDNTYEIRKVFFAR
jgi:hypothetical protein